MDGDQSRWLVVGLALNKVVVPALRSFTAGVVKDLYSALKALIYTQTFKTHLTHFPLLQQDACGVPTTASVPKKLQYGNINSNFDQNQKDKTKWNYSVQSPFDFAKLYLLPHMSRCSSFEDCDCTALLTFIKDIDDSSCKDIFRMARQEAYRLQDIRNLWAHCVFNHWDKSLYEKAFHTMSDILKLVNTGSDTFQSLENWRQQGLDLCKDEDIPTLVESYIKTEYHRRLIHFHQEHNLYHKHQNETLAKYLETIIFVPKKELEMQSCRHGFKEFINAPKRKVDLIIKPTDLFSKLGKLDENKDPRTVLLLGVPGIGKTMFCHKLLHDLLNHMIDLGIDKPIPFLVKFRETNLITNATSFQDFILNNCGPTVEKSCKTTIWKYLKDNEKNIIFILDGYDEGEGLGVNENLTFTQTFSAVDEPKDIHLLLYNLMKGTLMPQCRVLVTTRPFCASRIQNLCHRTIELDGLKIQQIKELTDREIGKDFPKLKKSFFRYLENNQSILGLCYVPRQAIFLIEYVKGKTEGTDSELNEEVMPKTMASMLLIIVLHMLKTSDLDRADKEEFMEEIILEERKETLLKLSNLAYEGLFSDKGVKQIFSELDIRKCGLTKQEIGLSIMSGYQLTRFTLMKKQEVLLLHSFPHLTIQEMLAVFKLLRMPTGSLIKLIRRNRGEHDMVWLLFFGACGDDTVRGLSDILLSGTLQCGIEEFEEKARCVLRAICESEKSKLSESHLFLLNALNESQLWSEADALTPAFINNIYCEWNFAQYGSSSLTPADYLAMSRYLTHVTSPIKTIRVQAGTQNKSLAYLLCGSSVKGFQGIGINDVYEDNAAIKNLVAEYQSLVYFQIFRGNTVCVPWGNTSLRYLSLAWVSMDPKWFIQTVQSLPSLDTLSLFTTMIHHQSWASVLSQLPNLHNIQHLTMRYCYLTDKDVKEVARLITTSKLEWLDLSGNKQVSDTGAMVLATALSSKECKLCGFRTQRCDAITPNGHRALCESLQGHPCMRTLHIGLGVCDQAAALVQANSNLEELDMRVIIATLSPSSPFTLALQQNNTIKVLIIYSRFQLFIEENFFDFSRNSSLECLEFSGDMTDRDVCNLTSALQHSRSVKMLRLRSSTQLSAGVITQLIGSTCLQLLDLRGCGLSEDGWRQAAVAVSCSTTLHSVGFGQYEEPVMATAFLQELSEYYPHNGALRNLYCYDKITYELASLAQTLKDRLHALHIYYGVEYADMRLQAGYMRRSVPAHRRDQPYRDAFLPYL